MDLFAGHGYRIGYEDAQARNSDMKSLIANYKSSKDHGTGI
jgi:hypothetical protein